RMQLPSIFPLILLFVAGIVLSGPSTPIRSRVRRQNMKVRINATGDTIVMKFLRPSPDTKLEGYILGYGSSMFSKQFIQLPENGKPYETEFDAEPKYLIAVQPIPVNDVKKQCTGKVELEKPLHLVIGTVTPTSVLLSWGTLLKTPYESNIMNDCLEDGHYTVRYRERNRKWNYQTCPTSDTVIDNLKPNTVYEFGVQPNTKEGNGHWSKPVIHNISNNGGSEGRICSTYNILFILIESPGKDPMKNVQELNPKISKPAKIQPHIPKNQSQTQSYYVKFSPFQKPEIKTTLQPYPPAPAFTTKPPAAVSPPTPKPKAQTTPPKTSAAPMTSLQTETKSTITLKTTLTSKVQSSPPLLKTQAPPKVPPKGSTHRKKQPNPQPHPRRQSQASTDPAASKHARPTEAAGTSHKPYHLSPVVSADSRFDGSENSSVFRPRPASDVDIMGKKRFVAPHVIYKTDKKPDEPCSITSSMAYFPDEEGNDISVTGPPKAPPSNLTVVTVEGCPSFVILDWEKSDNETREYEVVSTTKGPNGEEISVLTTNQTHTAVENLKPESSYEFKVTPRNELGTGPSSDPVSFSTESADPRVSEYVAGKDAIWTQFPFKADAYSECNGKQYVKRTWYRKFVGIQLCNSLRYKIYLSDSLNGKFYNIGDQTGFGEDHCQFVDSFLDGRTGTQLFAEQLPSRQGFFRALRQEPVHFGEIGGKSHVTYVGWYECGTPIPGKW
uniref:Fibronectin type-III domain-containing protein n=1 Tax=Periophthalmus magnuspinnatus TaxID=409849 RepID=A0A3B4A5V6_9GOBI